MKELTYIAHVESKLVVTTVLIVIHIDIFPDVRLVYVVKVAC